MTRVLAIRNVSAVAGFTLVELLISALISCALLGVLLRLVVTAQDSTRVQADVLDLHQRLRVASDAMSADLLIAGGSSTTGSWRGSLAGVLPVVVPARTGARDPDGELSYYADRLSVLYVPEGAAQTVITVAMGSAAVPLTIDDRSPGCTGPNTCGFASGDRLLVTHADGPGATYDIFTVSDTAAGSVLHDQPLTVPYGVGSVVMHVSERVFYIDRATSRLMVYDGKSTDLPLVDHVVDMRVTYYADPSPYAVPPPASGSTCVYAEGPPPVPLLQDLGGAALRPLTASQLTDGPVCGTAPHRFDADLLRVRRVRVTIRAETESDQLRAAGLRFARPGASLGGTRLVPDQQVTFDIAPPNLNIGQ